MSDTLILTTRLKEDRDYWMAQLARQPGLSNLPLDFKRSKIYSRKQDGVALNLSGAVCEQLTDLTSNSSFLIYATLMAALKICLHKYTRNTTIVVGSPAYRGDEDELSQLDALAIVDDVDDRLSFREFLLSTRETLSEAYARQNFPLGSLFKDSAAQAENKCPLFDIALVFEQIHRPLPEVKNDITITFGRDDGGLRGRVDFNARLFRRETIERFAGHYLKLLEGALQNTGAIIRDLVLVDGEERKRLLFHWNDTARDYPIDACLQQLFEAQVERTPEAIAVSFTGERLTYRELNERANQLANHLKELGVGDAGGEALVALCLDRSIDMVVAILGVLKRGAAIVPLDPAYPAERLRLMMEDAQVAVLITVQRLAAEFPVHSSAVVCLDTDWENIAAQPQTDSLCTTTSDNLLYVLYTSGSTGRPKGVAMSHRALVNLIVWQLQNSPLGVGARTLQYTSLSFDVSIQEIFSTLCAGGTLVMVSEQTRRDAVALANYLAAEKIERLFLPFVALQQLAEVCVTQALTPTALREIVTAGEQPQATPSIVEFFRRLANCTLANHYGPTESHVVTTLTLQGPPSRWPTLPPIGRPISNAQIYLLDSTLQPVPVGVAGDLYIGGIPVARGYLNRPDLTAEKFVPDPYAGKLGQRMYQTGDLARYLAEGNIEFLGRADHQVKLRGFRVELGEIEAALCRHPAVQEAVAMVREDVPGEKRLVAYVVTSQRQTPSTNELRRLLMEQLPEYMIPATFMVLDALPLTPTGKVDRRALPARDASRPQLEKEYVMPRNRVEEILASIWAEVLGVEKVGVSDNFFELGGDSILTVQIVAKANRAGLRLIPSQLFQHQTVAGLATVCGTAPVVRAEQGAVTGAVPLTPIQHWFFEQKLPAPHHFNMAYLFEVSRPLDTFLLEQAVRGLLVHHDALRLRFAADGAGWRQSICAPEADVPFSSFDFSAHDEEAQRAAVEETAGRLQASLNLEAGPLMRVAYFELGQSGGRVLVAIHHLAVDGVSWRILLEDLQRAYEQLQQGGEVELGTKTTSWQQWAERLAKHADSEEVKREVAYWTEEGRCAVSPLPVDLPDGEHVEASARVLSVSLSSEETEALLREVPKAYHTQINDVLLTGLAQALARWTGSQSLLVDLEGHGREEIAEDIDLSRTVGWFTSISPVLLEVHEGASLEEALLAVRQQLRQRPHNGIGYGLLRYHSSDTEIRDGLGGLPSAEVSFNYIGQVDQNFNESSLLKVINNPVGRIADSATPLPHKIYVNGIVFQGQLQMRFKYSEGLYQSSTIQQVAEQFLAALRLLIAHCCSAKRQRLRATDFPLLKLEQDVLDKAFEQISFVGMRYEASYENIEEAYPLSPAQEGILFHSLYAPETGVYVVQMSCTFRGLNVPAVERAWQRVVQRHPILRSAFVWGDLEKPLQVVGSRVEMQFHQQDWRGASAAAQEERLQSYLAADRSRGFEPSVAPLMRFALLRIQDDEYHFVWSHHHLLLDGWSIFMVLKEVFEYYEAFSKGRELSLPPPTASYRDYLAWLQEQDLSGAKAFWQRVLKGFTTPTPLRMEGTPDGEAGYDEQVIELPATLTAELQSLARQNHLTLNTLVQGAWSLLLSHYSNTKDVLFGATASGRHASLAGIEEMIGIFINVLPARVAVLPDAALLPWLLELQKEQFEVRDYEFSPLAQVQRWSEAVRGVPLFQSILSFENYPVDDSIRQYTQSLEISNVRSTSQTNYPITVVVAPLTRLKVRIVYDRSRFNAGFIRQLQDHFSTLLRNFVAQPEARLNAFAEILLHNEKSLLAVQQKQTAKLNSMRFKKVSPKAVNLPQGELVAMHCPDGRNTLPLVLRPAFAELDLTDWAKDNRDLIEAKLLQHGALLFRGFKIETAAQFEQLAQTVCPDLFGEYGDLPREGVSGKVYGSTPYPADKTILFHNESSHMQRWPLKIFFYCLVPALQGGETPFVDCRRAYQLLDEKLRERLAQKQLMYVRNYIDGLDVNWQSFFHTNDKSVVEELCRKAAMNCEWRNGLGLRTRQIRPAVAEHPKTGEMVLFNQIQLHHVSYLEPELRASLLTMYGEEDLPRSVYYGDGSPIEDSVIEEISEVYRRTAASFLWQQGDILLLDNMLVAHGRNPYLGERKIVVAMGEMIGDGSGASLR